MSIYVTIFNLTFKTKLIFVLELTELKIHASPTDGRSVYSGQLESYASGG
jgi:hypothetical protein